MCGALPNGKQSDSENKLSISKLARRSKGQLEACHIACQRTRMERILGTETEKTDRSEEGWKHTYSHRSILAREITKAIQADLFAAKQERAMLHIPESAGVRAG